MLLWDIFGKFPGTDYESFNYDWVIGKLKELKDSVAAALASEQAAAESADHAAGSMGLALIYRNKAKDYRDEAQGFANDAQDSADSIANVSNQVAVNTAEIDQLIAHAGDESGNTELLNIRVGFNGTTYNTAGEAVRSQVEEIADPLYTRLTTVNPGHYILGATGEEAADNNGVSTTFIDIIGRVSNTVKLRCSLNNAFGVAWYDENQRYLGGISGVNAAEYGYENSSTPQDIEITIPQNAAYIRASMRSSFYSNPNDFKILIPNVLPVYMMKEIDEKASYTSTNLIDLDTATDNYLVNAGTGKLQSNSQWMASDWIPVEAGEVYYISSAYGLGQIAFYTAAGVYISGVTNQGVSVSNKITIPANAALARVSIQKEYSDTTEFQKGSYRRRYTKYADQVPIGRVPLNFDTVYAHPEDDIIELLRENQGKKIVFEAGTYNIKTIYENRYGNDYFDEYTGYESGNEYTYGVGIGAGLPVFNGTEIIATPGAKFEFDYTGNNENVPLYFSCFASGDGAIMDGINVDADQVRYIVHDDYNRSGLAYHTKFKNCHMKNDHSQCIGGGMGNYGVYEINGNIFEGSYQNNISYHNAGSALAANQMIVKDNIFETRASYRYHGDSTNISTIIHTNNKQGAVPEFRAENASDSNVNIELIQYNNV